MNGFLVIDKPVGVTSHDVVAMVRRELRLKKVGHTGTLDPFATGVLPVALGEGTKAIPFLDEGEKEYRAVMRLGQATDTQDCTGRVIAEADWQDIAEASIREAAAGFVGCVSQIPPMFSAVKLDGVPLYKLARRGEEIERKPRLIEIFDFSLDEVSLPLVTFTVRCSRGTYVRTLAHDLGAKLGCGAHLVELRRTRSGLFGLSEALTLDEFRRLNASQSLNERLLTPYQALSQLMDIPISAAGVVKVGHGVAPLLADMAGEPAILPADGERVRLSHDRQLIAVAEAGSGIAADDQRTLRLLRVFNPLYPLH